MQGRNRAWTSMVAAVACLALLGACSGDGEAPEPTAPASPSPSPTVADASPSPIPSPVPSPSSVPSPSPSPAPSASPSEARVVLGPDGLGITRFGDDPETALEALSGRYGTPEQDTGWVSAVDSPFGVCPGDTVRGATWGQVTVLFTDGATDYGPAGRQHLFAFSVVARGEDPVAEYGQGPQTAEGIGVGSTVADVRAAYPGVVEVVDDGPPFGPSYFIDGGGAGPLLSGALTDTSDSGAVISVLGGAGCGE